MSRLSPEARCREHARTQFGFITRAQALDYGLSTHAIKRRVRAGVWVRIGPSLYLIDGAPQSVRQELMQACLLLGGVAAGRSAADLHGLLGFRAQAVEVVTMRSFVRAPEGVIVHRTNYLPAEDVTSVGGLPVTTPARTLLDLGGLVSSKLVARAAADALDRNKVTQPLLTDQLRRAGSSGRPGTAGLRAFLAGLDKLQPGPPTESDLEDAMLEIIARAGLPPPVRQFELREQGILLGRVDAAYPQQRIALEADGYEFHSARAEWLHDRRRQNAFVSRGWHFLRFTVEDRRVPQPFLADLTRLLRSLSGSLMSRAATL
ncbi:MAG: type IV toxin-antitoxin system AbiEi family antitoxin domain-containing protein [Actinomycetota bacterium]|nr:type IV toxin-antitoxin system AbiEi family antitoxin domain-containing protein [Actinomycetota bacterium]